MPIFSSTASSSLPPSLAHLEALHNSIATSVNTCLPRHLSHSPFLTTLRQASFRSLAVARFPFSPYWISSISTVSHLSPTPSHVSSPLIDPDSYISSFMNDCLYCISMTPDILHAHLYFSLSPYLPLHPPATRVSENHGFSPFISLCYRKTGRPSRSVRSSSCVEWQAARRRHKRQSSICLCNEPPAP